MKRFIAALLACLALATIGQGQAIAAATILPPGETCFSGNTGTTGMVGALGTITGGAGGTAGTYGGVALTGGSGSGATANITVAGGVVTAVSILNPGTQYVVADVLSAVAGTIGGTVGFSVPVNSVSINSALAGGSVAFYIPSTNTFKQTWKDAAQTVLNTNPATLDANGCLIAYGTGSYRQVVKDSLGNTIWDQVTADTSSFNNTFWAGNAGGTPNAITVVDPGFNATDGTIINFVPVFTNTGATTLNPSSFGNIPIVKDTTTGYVALTGGEIVAPGGGLANVVSVIYNATQNNFHLLNAVIASASGSSQPLCGASGLRIANNVGTPNTLLDVTAQAVMANSSGVIINRSVVATLNTGLGTAISTAGGMDGEPVGTSQWIYVWVIDNGSASNTLGSTSSTAPTLPSGYTYKCRVGSVRVDGGGNLLRTFQQGIQVQYVETASTIIPLIDNGVKGTYSATSPVLVGASILTIVPTTAIRITVLGTGTYQGNGPHNLEVAPTTDWSGTNRGPNGSTGSAWPLWLGAASLNSASSTFSLESTSSIAWAGSGTGSAIFCLGWTEGGVNAN